VSIVKVDNKQTRVTENNTSTSQTGEVKSERKRQEAQLSQRGRAMLRVIEYFAQLLKATQGHSKDVLEYGVCRSLLAL